MARVTVEDCTNVIPSRFELVAIAAQRAKDISAGAESTVSKRNDKNAVIALREIAEHKLNVDNIRENIIQNSQERVKTDRYGVEKVVSGEEAGLSSDEIAEEVKSLAVTETPEGSDPLLYADNLDDVED